MTSEKREAEVPETLPRAKPKWTLTLVVALSMVVGILLTLTIGGAIYHFRSVKAQTNELAASKEELKHKTQQLGEMQEQIVGLSQQIHALKDFAIAKASSAAATGGEESAVAPAENHKN